MMLGEKSHGGARVLQYLWQNHLMEFWSLTPAIADKQVSVDPWPGKNQEEPFHGQAPNFSTQLSDGSLNR